MSNENKGEICSYCEPSHKRMMPNLRNVWNRKQRENLNYQIRIGKSWKGQKFKSHRLMLFSHGWLTSSLRINYCPFCGRGLGSGN